MTTFEFGLPGRWWKVPLSSRDAMIRSAAALAEHVLGRADQLAQLRAEMKASVVKAADAAADSNARDFYFATEVVPGVPVPLLLAVYAPTLPPRLSTDASGQAAADALGAALRTGDSEATISTWAQGDTGVVRDLRVVQGSPEEEVSTARLRIDYWLVRRDSADTLVMSFTAPMYWEQVGESLLALTDAVVSTVSWAPASPTD